MSKSNKNISPMRKVVCAILCVVVIFIAIIAVAAVLSDDTETVNSKTKVETTLKKTKSDKYKKVYEDKNIKVSYVKLYEVDGVDNVIYLQLKYENKTGKRVTLTPKDASVNKMAVTLATGVPTNIGPDETSMNPLIIPTANIEAKSTKDVENIKLKFSIRDEDFDEFATTKEISIDIK